jgi:phosphoadenosine phosphosulfate reductase
VVLIDMLWRINPQARVFTLDTFRLHTETYEVIDEVRERYGIETEVYQAPLVAITELVREQGNNGFYKGIPQRVRCCAVRKVEPLGRALSELQAWITGLRADQAATRTDTQKIEIDVLHGGMAKLNPIVDWTSDQVWDYIRANNVPYNALHDQGFPSIGCAPCTRAVAPGEDPRAGRWWWEQEAEDKECGLHVEHAPDGSIRVVRGPA